MDRIAGQINEVREQLKLLREQLVDLEESQLNEIIAEVLTLEWAKGIECTFSCRPDTHGYGYTYTLSLTHTPELLGPVTSSIRLMGTELGSKYVEVKPTAFGSFKIKATDGTLFLEFLEKIQPKIQPIELPLINLSVVLNGITKYTGMENE